MIQQIKSIQSFKNKIFIDTHPVQIIRQVYIYIRTVTKKSIKIELPSQIPLILLKHIIQKNFHIPQESQLLYLKGTCLNFNYEILLENNWIIHVIDLNEVRIPFISVEVKRSIFGQKQEIKSKLTISTSMSIKKFIQEHICPIYSLGVNDVILVQSGRILKKKCTFLDENIQNGTTINVICPSVNQKCLTSSNNFYIPNNPEQKNERQNQEKNKTADVIETPSQQQINRIKTTQNTKSYQDQFVESNQNQKENATQSLLTDVSVSHKIGVQCKKSLNSNKKIIHIGHRQCNCKNQQKIEKKPKFITAEDKKKLSIQIREENLNKLNQNKLRRLKSIDSLPIEQKKKLSNIKSVDKFKSTINDRLSPKRIPNPSKFKAS